MKTQLGCWVCGGNTATHTLRVIGGLETRCFTGIGLCDEHYRTTMRILEIYGGKSVLVEKLQDGGFE